MAAPSARGLPRFRPPAGADYGAPGRAKEWFALDMAPVLTQMGILVFIMAVGFFCTKIGLTGEEFTRSASKVVLNVLLVFTIFDSVASADIGLSLADVGWDILVFFAMFAVITVISLITPRLLRIEKSRSGVAFFCICFANTVFVGFPIIESIYGEEGVLVAILSNIPLQYPRLQHRHGPAQRRREGPQRAQHDLRAAGEHAYRRGLVPDRWPLPGFVTQCLDMVGSCTAPMSMLVVGASLGAIPARAALSDWKVYVVSFARLLVTPLAVWAVLRLFVHDELLLGVCVVLASCPRGHGRHAADHTDGRRRGVLQPVHICQHGVLRRDDAARHLAAALSLPTTAARLWLARRAFAQYN